MPRLLAQGVPYREIADRLGYPSENAANKAVLVLLHRTETEAVTDLRALEAERPDQLTRLTIEGITASTSSPRRGYPRRCYRSRYGSANAGPACSGWMLRIALIWRPPRTLMPSSASSQRSRHTPCPHRPGPREVVSLTGTQSRGPWC